LVKYKSGSGKGSKKAHDAAVKAAATKKRNAAGKKAALTKKRQAAARKAAETRKAIYEGATPAEKAWITRKRIAAARKSWLTRGKKAVTTKTKTIKKRGMRASGKGVRGTSLGGTNLRQNSPTKFEVMSFYSQISSKSVIPCCACCKEDIGIEVLTIDHIKGRKKGDKKKSEWLYRYLKNNDYPDGYQVLCFNCNAAKGVFGFCPHQRSK